MVIIYGCGQHLNILMDKYYIPIDDIEAIIDNRLAEKFANIGTVEVISFKQYLNERTKYTA